MKTCIRCTETKDISDFYSQKDTKDKLSPWCKQCAKAYVVSWKASYPKRLQATTHKYRQKMRAEGRLLHIKRKALLKGRYGLTLDDYDRMLKSQGDGCAICGAKSNPAGRNLAVDHDHSTQVVRGILCSTCNLILGMAKDSVSTLQSAIKYLQTPHPTYPLH